MLLDRIDLFFGEAAALFGEAERAEAAVFLMPPGAAGDLRHLGYGQAAIAAAVEFLEAGEGDMGDVHVEAHADGVGGDEIIDLAALEHRDLCIARCGGKRAHDDRCAALEPAEHLGERVDLLGGEGDDGRARRQARELDAAGVAQSRKTRTADDLGVRQELADDWPQRVGAEDQSLLAATGAEHPVGEDVAAFRVDAELRLVDRREREIAVEVRIVVAVAARHRHTLSGAEEITRLRRDNALLAGQQRDLLLALHRDDSVIDLAREQPQREPDDPRGVAAHPFDGKKGLAGVGRPEDRPNRSV